MAQTAPVAFTGTRLPTQTDDVLSRLEAKLDRIDERLQRVDALYEQLPALLSTVGDIVDDQAEPLRIHERVEAGLRMLEHITRPETLAKTEKLLAQLDSLPTTIAATLDVFDGFVDEAERQGIDVAGFVPRVFELLARSARAVQGAEGAEPMKPGVFALLRTMKDPEVRAAMGFFLQVARGFGGDLQSENKALPPGGAI